VTCKHPADSCRAYSVYGQTNEEYSLIWGLGWGNKNIKIKNKNLKKSGV